MSFLTEIRTHKIRTCKTLAVYSVFLTFGLSSGLLGPTLLDLQILVNGTIGEVSYVMPGRSVGIIIGSLITGYIYPKSNYQLLAAGCMFVTMLCNIAIPLNSNAMGLMATFAVSGLLGGIAGSGANLFVLQLWGKESQPFMQVLQSCYGIGCIITPLIARPFLLPVVEGEEVLSKEFSSNGTIVKSPTVSYTPSDVRLIYPYIIVAVCHLIPISSFLYLFWKHPTTDPHPSRVTSSKTVAPNDAEGKEKCDVVQRVETADERFWNNFWKAVMIIVVLIYMPCLYGTELTYGSYLTTFAVESNLHMTKGTAVILTSMYWAIFTFFRFAPVLYIHLIGAEMNIVINTCLMLAANFFTYPWAENNEYCLWIGTFLMGVGQSSTFASVFGFLENYFQISSFLASFMLVTSFTGEFIFPFVISYFIDDRPKIFLEVVLSCTIAMSVLFFLSAIIGRLKLKRNEHERTRTTSSFSVIYH